MPIFYSAASNGFFDDRVHRSLPDDAVAITAERHTELLALQSAGKVIQPGRNGHPTARAIVSTIEKRRAAAIVSIKAAARTRILAISDIERQSNDNALIAGFALQLATGVGDIDEKQASDAVARRAAIDAIRAASNALESTIVTLSAADLAEFDANAAPHWPA